jgi:putative aminopeptidase FrvX
MATPDLLQALITTPGPSGHETGPAKVWREACSAFADDVRGDKVGSSMARVPGTGDGPTLAIIGHIDEIGVHVSHIDEEGYLRFGEVGGWDPIVLVGQRVRLATRGGDVIGVIGRKPIHLIKSDERDRAPKVKDLHIDIGAKDGNEARELVRIGDVGVIDGAPVELPNGRVISRSMDNRIGCYVAAEAARLVAADGGAPGDVVALAVAQEETTFAGSRTSAFGLDPDLTVESLGRQTGTDADAVHATRTGIPTGLVSVPLRYMHSPVELVSLADVQVAAELIAAFARRLEPGMSFER